MNAMTIIKIAIKLVQIKKQPDQIKLELAVLFCLTNILNLKSNYWSDRMIY